MKFVDKELDRQAWEKFKTSPGATSPAFDFGGLYWLGAVLTGGLTFLISWIYCIATYGYLLGFGLGWLPSIIAAVIAGALWPLIALGIAGILLLVFAK